MSKFRKFIIGPGVDEASYQGNLGFEEMVKFYRKANDSEIKEMEAAIKKSDWEKFKYIIYKVINIKLQ